MAWLDALLLRTSSSTIRRKAVEHLSGSTRPSDTELLCASLHDRDPQVRCAAVRALANTNTPEAQGSLADALQDPNFRVREASAHALGRLGAVNCAPALVTCLRDPDAAVRIAAGGALQAMGWRPSTQEDLAWFEIALGRTPAAIPVNGVPAPPPGVPNQDTAFYRRLADEEKKEKTDPRRINALLADLRANNSLARLSAVHDLGQVIDPQITQVLLALFRDQDHHVRLAAAQVLAKRDDSPPAHFVGLLQDPCPEVRIAAIHFLSRIHHEQIVQVLFPLLSDPELQVRQATASALGQIGNAAAIEALVVSLVDQDEPLRQRIQLILMQANPEWMDSTAAFKARVRLEALLETRPPADAAFMQMLLARLPSASTDPAECVQR